MESPRVHLRPFEEADLTMCDRFATDPEFAGPFEWTGPRSPEAYRRRWEADGLIGASPYNLVVADDEDDRAVGWVDWRDTERAGPEVWEIGVLVVPERRGSGIGTDAHRLLVDRLFETTRTNRIWAGTEVGNIVEQRALESSGFQQEGRLRGHVLRDGRWRDLFIYGQTRHDHAQIESAAA